MTQYKLQHKLYHDARSWGILGDGTDFTTDINAALTDIGAAGDGGTLYFPEGTYLLSAELAVPDNVTIAGAGIDKTTFLIGLAQGGTWNAAFINSEFDTVGNVGGANFNLGFRDFTIDGQVGSRGSDPATGMAFKAGARVRVERVRFTLLHETVAGGNGAGIVLLRTDDDEHNEDLHVTGCEFVDLDGYAVAGSDTVGGYFADNIFRNCGNGIWLEPNDAVGGTGDNASFLRIEGNLFQDVNRGVVVYGDAHDGDADPNLRFGAWHTIADNLFIENAICAILGGSPYMSITGNVISARDGGMSVGGIRAEKSFISVVGNTILGKGGGPGILLGGTLAVQKGLVATGNISMNNGDAGIYLSKAEDCVVSGNRCGDDQTVKTQSRSIWEDADCDYNQIADNHVTDFVSLAVQKTGANTVVRNNLGFVTDNRGTATVTNGSTTVVVNHGLGLTPTLQNISVTPTNNLGSATKFWISTVTSTQFTINVDVNPGVTTATFVWTAFI